MQGSLCWAAQASDKREDDVSDEVGKAMLRLSVALVLLCLNDANAETVNVKYRGLVDLKPFACTDTDRSSFVRQVCFDKLNSYMLIKLQNTWYHYCRIPEATVHSLTNAESVGRFYNAQVKGNFHCRLNPVPRY
jgi:hypothetical protein